MRRVVIAHGYTAHPLKHWFPWLRRQLEAQGVELTIPQLPKTEAPVCDEWVKAVSDALGTPDEKTVLIGHSLGCVTALHALNRLTPQWQLGGLILVAGFDEPLSNLPELDPFTATQPNHAPIIENVAFRASLVADNDQVVAPERSLAMAGRLKADVCHIQGHHHFTESTGVFELPHLLPLLAGVPGLQFDATVPPVPGPTAPAALELLAELTSPLVIDVRDPEEVAEGKGGPPGSIPGSVNVPLNVETVGQGSRVTTPDEFAAKLAEAGVLLPEDKSAPIITHCGSGGRGGKAARLLRHLGYENAFNGGGPKRIAEAWALR